MVVIEWNPISGCSHRSEGCIDCQFANDWVVFHPEDLHYPAAFQENVMVRLCSRGDFFHNHVQTEWQLSVLKVINRSRATFVILTKRPCIAIRKMLLDEKPLAGFLDHPRIWLGVVAEDMDWVQNRTPHLFALRFAKRFVKLGKTCE